MQCRSGLAILISSLLDRSLPIFAQNSKIGTVTKGFNARLLTGHFLVLIFGHCGAQPWAPECPKVKIKNGRLATPGVEYLNQCSYFGYDELKWVYKIICIQSECLDFGSSETCHELDEFVCFYAHAPLKWKAQIKMHVYCVRRFYVRFSKLLTIIVNDRPNDYDLLFSWNQ